MRETNVSKKTAFSAGWILVTGLLLLCIAGTGLTWWNYSRQVFSSADGIIIESPSPDCRISVELPIKQALKVLPGQGARVTPGNNAKMLHGEVVSVNPGTTTATVILRIPSGVMATLGESKLPIGLRCGVTIDTTVPPYSQYPVQ